MRRWEHPQLLLLLPLPLLGWVPQELGWLGVPQAGAGGGGGQGCGVAGWGAQDRVLTRSSSAFLGAGVPSRRAGQARPPGAEC